MTDKSKWARFWLWSCSRGWVFFAYVCIAISSALIFHVRSVTDVEVDDVVAAFALLSTASLIVAGTASAHAVVYGINACNAFMVKLEIPALRILAAVVAFHGVLDISAGREPAGFLQLGVAALLLHEMRAISHLRKGPHGGLIYA